VRLGAKRSVIGAKQGIVAPRAWRRWFEFLPLPAWVERANQLAYANRVALSLFGSSSVAALQRVWKQLRPSLPACSGGLAAARDQADTVPCSAYAQARTKGGATVNLEIFFAPLPGSSQTTLFLARPTPPSNSFPRSWIRNVPPTSVFRRNAGSRHCGRTSGRSWREWRTISVTRFLGFLRRRRL